MKEEFRDVLGYEGIYQVSNLGNVKSLARVIDRGDSYRTLQEKILKPGLIGVVGNRYYAVILYINGYMKSHHIHQLVAQAFIDQNYISNGLVVNHRDGNPLNNNLENLEIVTYRINTSTEKCKNRIVTSTLTGVSWNKSYSKWQSHIRIERKTFYLGYFTDEIEAGEIYQRALNIYLENGIESFLKFRDSLGIRKYKKRSLTKCT